MTLTLKQIIKVNRDEIANGGAAKIYAEELTILLDAAEKSVWYENCLKNVVYSRDVLGCGPDSVAEPARAVLKRFGVKLNGVDNA